MKYCHPSGFLAWVDPAGASSSIVSSALYSASLAKQTPRPRMIVWRSLTNLRHGTRNTNRACMHRISRILFHPCAYADICSMLIYHSRDLHAYAPMILSDCGTETCSKLPILGGVKKLVTGCIGRWVLRRRQAADHLLRRGRSGVQVVHELGQVR